MITGIGLFLSAVKSRTVAEGSILVVYSLDRLSRLEIGHAKQTYYDLTNNGVSVYALVDNHLYRAHNAADDIIATITFERAHNESKNKSRRVIDAAKQALKRWKETGEPQRNLGRTPFWIDQPTNTHNVNAKGVLKAIEMYLGGDGVLKISQHLRENYEYIPVRNKNMSRTKEDNWDISSLFQTFGRPSLIGEKHISIEGTKHKLENYYPPLIDLETFQRLQDVKGLKGGRAPLKGTTHLLKGLVKCGVCGGAMVFVDKGRGNQAINYVCSNAAKGKHERENYSVQMLELAAIRLCSDELLRVNSSEGAYEAERAQLVKEKRDLEEELIDLKERYTKKKRQSFFDLIEQAEDKLEVVISELEGQRRTDTESAFKYLSDVNFSADVMNDFTHPERGELRSNLIQVIDKIEISRRKESCQSTKSKDVNCLTVNVLFKNGQHRVLKSKPFEYIVDGREQSIFIGYEYEYDVPFDEYSRNGQLIPDLINELHSYDLLHKLYPSKGRYNWKGKSIELGTIELWGTNLLGALDYITAPDSWKQAIEKHYEKGIMYTRVDKNTI